MSNWENHTRTTADGTYIWLSPVNGGYMLMCVNKDKESAEAGLAQMHESGVWAYSPTTGEGLYAADALRCIAELIDQLNLETDQEKVA